MDENRAELKKLVCKIFKIIPSYYDETEANEIEELITQYVNNILKQR
jgi:hypothetical protein